MSIEKQDRAQSPRSQESSADKASQLHLSPSFRKYQLMQRWTEAIVESTGSGRPPLKEPIPGPLRVDPCSVWGASRRSAELSKAEESPYSVLTTHNVKPLMPW